MLSIVNALITIEMIPISLTNAGIDFQYRQARSIFCWNVLLWFEVEESRTSTGRITKTYRGHIGRSQTKTLSMLRDARHKLTFSSHSFFGLPWNVNWFLTTKLLNMYDTVWAKCKYWIVFFFHARLYVCPSSWLPAWHCCRRSSSSNNNSNTCQPVPVTCLDAAVEKAYLFIVALLSSKRPPPHKHNFKLFSFAFSLISR